MSTAAASPDIKELYPEVFFTNGFTSCDENIIRAKNIKLVIMIDRNRVENKENFNSNAQSDKGFDGTEDGKRGFGSDVEILEITFGKPGKPIEGVLCTCDQVARLLMEAKTARKGSLIIDYNNDAQRSVTIIVAYLIYHQTQSFYKAFAMLSKYYSKIKLNKYYSDILFDYERVILTKLKQKTQNSIDVVKNVTSDFNLTDSKNIEYAIYDPYNSQDYIEKVAMVQHLNAGKPMETFVSESEQEKIEYELEHPYKGGAGEWNDSIHTDLLDEEFDNEYAIEFD